MEHRAHAERPRREAKETFAPAQDSDDGVDQANKIQTGGDAQPKNAGFSHLAKGFCFQYRGNGDSVLNTARPCPYSGSMEVHFSPDVETQLELVASAIGKATEQLVRETVDSHA